VYSEPGLGTTFNIFLPKVYEDAEAVSPLKSDNDTRGGSETIIIAEDDPEIRDVAEEYLSRLGYRVLTCENGKSALDASIASGAVDLLVTDLIMPGINGKELATRMTTLHKELKVLYTSGYTADIIGRHGMLEPGVEFLPKPYVLSDLGRRVRECIDN
jgi:CheY-like chemotaxis protein